MRQIIRMCFVFVRNVMQQWFIAELVGTRHSSIEQNAIADEKRLFFISPIYGDTVEYGIVDFHLF